MYLGMKLTSKNFMDVFYNLNNYNLYCSVNNFAFFSVLNPILNVILF